GGVPETGGGGRGSRPGQEQGPRRARRGTGS
ncbi:hypothetical protein Kpho02_59810, partial [Kitasatospora phosalacinea]